MFLSGNQTRRIGPLVDQYPEPLLELHPALAQKHGIADGDWVTVESRRGRMTVRCQVVTTIRPDTVFVPYHWPGKERQPGDHRRPGSDLEDPGVQGLRGAASQGRGTGVRQALEATAMNRATGGCCLPRDGVLHRPDRCIGCQACVHACAECDTHKGHSMIHLEYVDRRALDADRPTVLHALRLADLRRGLPGRRDQATGDGVVMTARKPRCIACSQLRAGLPVRRAQDDDRVRPDDEVRHVLRPTSTGASPCAPRSAPAGPSSTERVKTSSGSGNAPLSERVPVRPADDPHEGQHDGCRISAPPSEWTSRRNA
jgi:ferredoxin